MKKNLLMMAFAAIALFASSCKKEQQVEQLSDTKLKVRIGNVGVKARAIGNPAIATQITLTNGIIFITNDGDNITYKEVIKTSEVTGSGQILDQQVKKTDKVYIIGNIPTALTTELMGATTLTITSINEKMLSIAEPTYGQDYTKVTLANTTGDAKDILVDNANNTATVSVNIAPVYSRIELKQIDGNDNNTTNSTITSFDVTGVYVTDYYLQYSLNGLFGGTIYKQNQSTDFTTVDQSMKNEGTYTSTGTNPSTAIAAAGKSWVYNVPAGALPRLIVKIINVQGNKNGGAVDNTNPYYITMTGYSKNGNPIAKFERAKIYRLEKLAFTADYITNKPNEDVVNLTVNVTVDDWAIEVVDGEI